MCKKQTSVSHSSTEAEIISVNAGLRMNGIPALTLWDLVIEVFVPYRTEQMDPRGEPSGNPSAVVLPNMHNQPFQLHLLHQEFQLDKLLHNGEEDTRSKRRRKSCVQVATSSDVYIFFYCDKFLLRIKSDCVEKSGDADSFGENRQQDEY